MEEFEEYLDTYRSLRRGAHSGGRDVRRRVGNEVP